MISPARMPNTMPGRLLPPGQRFDAVATIAYLAQAATPPPMHSAIQGR